MAFRQRLLASSIISGFVDPIQLKADQQLCGECQKKNPHLLRAPSEIIAPPIDAYCFLCSADLYASNEYDGVIIPG